MDREQVYKYGEDVFNNEKDKFYRWLSKPNISLGGKTPEQVEIEELKQLLNKIEYGNFS